MRYLPQGQVRYLPPGQARSSAVPPTGIGAEQCGTSRRGGCGAVRCGTPRADVHRCVSGRRVPAAPAPAGRVPEPARRAGLIRCRCPLLPAPASAPAEREGAARPRPDHPGLLPPAPCLWALGSCGWRDGATCRAGLPCKLGSPSRGFGGKAIHVTVLQDGISYPSSLAYTKLPE